MADILTKNAWERTKFTVDLEPALGDAEIASVDSVTVIETGHGINISNATRADTSVTFYAADGVVGRYHLRIRVITNDTPLSQRRQAIITFEIT